MALNDIIAEQVFIRLETYLKQNLYISMSMLCRLKSAYNIIPFPFLDLSLCDENPSHELVTPLLKVLKEEKYRGFLALRETALSQEGGRLSGILTDTFWGLVRVLKNTPYYQLPKEAYYNKMAEDGEDAFNKLLAEGGMELVMKKLNGDYQPAPFTQRYDEDDEEVSAIFTRSTPRTVRFAQNVKKIEPESNTMEEEEPEVTDY